MLYFNTKELMERILKKVKEDGRWLDDKGAMPVDYCLTHYVEMTNVNLDEVYDKDITFHIDFGGSEGIYLDVDIVFMEQGKMERCNICTIKTLADSEDAFVAYATLGAFIKLAGRRILREYLKELENATMIRYVVFQMPMAHPAFANTFEYYERNYKRFFSRNYQLQFNALAPYLKREEDTLKEIYLLHSSESISGHRMEHRMCHSDAIVLYSEVDEPIAYFVEDRGDDIRFQIIPYEAFRSLDNQVYLENENRWEFVQNLSKEDEYFTIMDSYRDGDFRICHLQDIRLVDVTYSTNRSGESYNSFGEAYDAVVVYMDEMKKLPFYQEHVTNFYVLPSMWHMERLRQHFDDMKRKKKVE